MNMSFSRILCICLALVLANHSVSSTFLASMILKNRQEKVLNRFLNEIRELDLNPSTPRSITINNAPRQSKPTREATPASGGSWKANPVELKVNCELGAHETGSRVSLCCQNPPFFSDKASGNSVNCKSLAGELGRPHKDIRLEMEAPESKDLTQALSNFIKLVEELDSRGGFRQSKI